MSLFKARVFQNSLFKQMRWWVSKPEKAYKALCCSESGEIGIQILPLGTGFLLSKESSRAWRFISDLAIRFEEIEGRLLPIGERSYVPLDPQGKLNAAEKAKLSIKSSKDATTKTVVLDELDSIAAREHGIAVTKVRDASAGGDAAAMFRVALLMSGIILVLIVIAHTIWK